MKDPKVKWPSDSETATIVQQTGKSKAEIEDLIEKSIRRAQKMAGRGVALIAPILNGKRSTWEGAWNKNKTLTKWFGKVTKANHVKDVHRRLDTICDRFANKVQTIKVNATLPKGFAAQNLGGALSPNTFKVAIKWIEISDLNSRAAVMIHESKHDWNKDQKIDGESVYGADMARKLARQNAGKARRSPENYEHYCLDVQSQHESGSGSTPSSARKKADPKKKAGAKKKAGKKKAGTKKKAGKNKTGTKKKTGSRKKAGRKKKAGARKKAGRKKKAGARKR